MTEAIVEQTASLGLTNFLKYFVDLALSQGVGAGEISLLLILPLSASLIAAARHFIGIRGFGIFAPAMLAVVFLISGLSQGVAMLVVILLLATASRILTRKFKVHYLARMAFLVWFICLGVFASTFWLRFPLLPLIVLIILAESFVEIQISKSPRDATRLTGETFILAIMIYWLLSWKALHRFAISQPEILVIGTALLDLLIGRFTGIRLLEYNRFKRLLK